jgi:uncharacterized membrane protein
MMVEEEILPKTTIYLPAFLSLQSKHFVRQAGKSLACIRNEINKKYNLRGCSIGITAERDLWLMLLRWPHVE